MADAEPALPFQEGKYKQALLQYKKIVSWLEYESSFSAEEVQKAQALRLASHLNLAMCHLKLQAFPAAIENCNKVRRHGQRSSETQEASWQTGMEVWVPRSPKGVACEQPAPWFQGAGRQKLGGEIFACSPSLTLSQLLTHLRKTEMTSLLPFQPNASCLLCLQNSSRTLVFSAPGTQAHTLLFVRENWTISVCLHPAEGSKASLGHLSCEACPLTAASSLYP